jgi:hypothetical protein
LTIRATPQNPQPRGECMSEQEFQAAYEKVLTVLGLWKPDRICRLTDKDGRCTTHNTVGGSHDIPAPELTDAVAWQVLLAGLELTMKRDIRVDINLRARDPKRALILALADALGR